MKIPFTQLMNTSPCLFRASSLQVAIDWLKLFDGLDDVLQRAQCKYNNATYPSTT